MSATATGLFDQMLADALRVQGRANLTRGGRDPQRFKDRWQ